MKYGYASVYLHESGWFHGDGIDLLNSPADCKDGTLRRVDNRGELTDAEHTKIRNGEGATLNEHKC